MSIMQRIFIILVFFVGSIVNAYESEEKLKVIITGKIAQFIFWEKLQESDFTIAVYKSPFLPYFEKIYKNSFIHKKKVTILPLYESKTLNNSELLQKIDMLYIGDIVFNKELEKILGFIEDHNIVTISTLRGFAQKGGMIQIYEQNQKLKLRINLEQVKKENINIKSSLLRISDIIVGEKR